MNGRNNYKKLELLLLFLLMVGSGLISYRLGQDASWDFKDYHFYNAYSFLNGRLQYDLAPAQGQTFYNPLLDLPFYWLMTHLTPIACGFLIGALHGINIWLIYKITDTIFIDLSKKRKCLLSLIAGVVGYYGAANFSEIGTTFNDNVTSLFVLYALLLIFSSIHTQSSHTNNLSKTRIIVAGFLIGCATGLKLPTAIYALAFAMSLLFMSLPWKTKLLNTILSCIGIGCGIITTLGYWMIILWKNFQSPLFPFYNKIFQSPYFAYVNAYDNRFLPKDKYQVLFYPFHFLKNPLLVSEVGFRDIRFSVCYMLFMLLIFMVYYKGIARKHGGQELMTDLKNSNQMENNSIFLIAFFVLSYVIWQYKFSTYRFLIPIELLAPVFIITIIRYIFPFERILFWISIGIFAVMIVTMSPMHWGRSRWTGSYFDVRIPSLKNIANATVIMADSNPLSYIIPSFPKSTRFVSVNNNIITPTKQNKYQEKIKETLRSCKGNLFLLYKERTRSGYESTLAFYNFKMNKQNWVKISAKFDHDLYLVPLSRIR